MTMADKIVVMRGGHIEQVGRPLDLYDRPANRFVAGFIGSPGMNFLEGGIVTDQSGTFRFISRNGLAIPVRNVAVSLPSDVVVIGIRPEHISIRSDAADDDIPMTIAVVEPTGNETTILLRSGKDELVVVLNGRHAFRPGETAWLGF